MNSVIIVDLISGAVGSGVVLAALWVPLVWLAMRKLFKLRAAKGLGVPFAISWALFSLLAFIRSVFFIEPPSGLIYFVVAPICISAVVLYLTFRKPILQA